MEDGLRVGYAFPNVKETLYHKMGGESYTVS